MRYMRRVRFRQVSQLSRCLVVRSQTTASSSGGKDFKNASLQGTVAARKRQPTVLTQTDGQTIYRSPYPNVPLPNQTLGEFMFEHLDRHADLTLLVDSVTGRSFTGASLKEASIKVASALSRLGYHKGNVVMVLSSNCPEFTVIYLACAAIGVTVTTANPGYTPHEIARQLSHSGACAVFTQTRLVPGLERAVISKPELHTNVKDIITIDGEFEGCYPFSKLLEDSGSSFPEHLKIDPATTPLVMPYSSGTTGLPKGVVLTHANMVSNLECLAHGQLRYRAGDEVVMALLPLFHIYGLSVVQFAAISQGATLLTVPKFDPKTFLEYIAKYKVTYLPLVPPMVLFLAKSPLVSQYDLSSLRTLVCGAAPLGKQSTELVQQRLNVNLLQAYGSSEVICTHYDEVPHKPGTIGTLVPNTTAKVIDPESGLSLPAGQTGELVIKGPQIMKKYHNNPVVTRETLVDGWLRTGDLGYFDTEGYFTITDRLKEIIKYKGYQVAPAELEAVLASHTGIDDAAVVGMTAGEGVGEVPRAFVVLKSGSELTEEDVVKFVADRVAAYKQLRGGVKFVDSVPRSASGKLLRRSLKE